MHEGRDRVVGCVIKRGGLGGGVRVCDEILQRGLHRRPCWPVVRTEGGRGEELGGGFFR